MTLSLTATVALPPANLLYSFADAALLTETSITLVKSYVKSGVIDAIGDRLPAQAIIHMAQMQQKGRLSWGRLSYQLEPKTKLGWSSRRATLYI